MFSIRPNRLILSRVHTAGRSWPGPLARRADGPHTLWPIRINRCCWTLTVPCQWTLMPTTTSTVALAGSRADDSAPLGLSVDSALKVLGVSEGASFDEIQSAKNSIISSRKDDQEAISQVEAAYDMLLMQSLMQRCAGKVANNAIRYADVKTVDVPSLGSMPHWLKKSPVDIMAPTTENLGVQSGVYGAMMVLTYINGVSSSSVGSYAGTDVPGFILAASFGASLYFMTKNNVKLGKATLSTVGGLVGGLVVGSAVENWLQVDIIPFLGLSSPAALISEFIIISQFLVSMYLRGRDVLNSRAYRTWYMRH